MIITKLLDFTHKVVVVTGAAAGIGEAIAERFLEAGAYVVLIDNNEETLKNMYGTVAKQYPEQAEYHVIDVSNSEAVESLFHDIATNHGTVHVLVNNAGIYPMRSIVELTEAEFDKVLDVNLKGVFNFTKQAARLMIDTQKAGSIVNITSIDAIHPSMVGLAHYDASKHGVWGFTKNAALEFAQHHIRVNAVAPGGIKTPGTELPGSLTEVQKLVQKDTFMQKIPLERMGEPDEIATTVLFLASSMASYITGAQIVVDGGYLLG